MNGRDEYVAPVRWTRKDGTVELIEDPKKTFRKRRRRKRKRKSRRKEPVHPDLKIVQSMRRKKKVEPHVHVMTLVERPSQEPMRFYKCIACRCWVEVTSPRLNHGSIWSPRERFVVILEG